jgi:NAD(P)-dependent dehydrogenase (short-subunit alcohol dehydrogenase family)
MDEMTFGKWALIVGASRGLGFALVEEFLNRSWGVVATGRTNSLAHLKLLQNGHGGRLEISAADINDPQDIAGLRKALDERKFDLLFISAGTTNDPDETIGEVKTEEFIRVMLTNALSPMRVIEALQGLVVQNGTIGVMSSALGSIADNDYGSWEVYRASKAALNTLMRSFAARQAPSSRTFLIVAPGWVRTGIGGPDADLSVSDSANGIADTIIGRAGQPGVSFVDYRGRRVRW